jgi:hypothetical protein
VGTNRRKPSVEYTHEDIEFIWRTNFQSMFELTCACHDLLKRSNDGTQTSSVVNIGSVAGLTCIKTGTPYASTKAAMNQVHSFTRVKTISTTLHREFCRATHTTIPMSISFSPAGDWELGMRMGTRPNSGQLCCALVHQYGACPAGAERSGIQEVCTRAHALGTSRRASGSSLSCGVPLLTSFRIYYRASDCR